MELTGVDTRGAAWLSVRQPPTLFAASKAYERATERPRRTLPGRLLLAEARPHSNRRAGQSIKRSSAR
jgi:hypothetical protein